MITTDFQKHMIEATPDVVLPESGDCHHTRTVARYACLNRREDDIDGEYLVDITAQVKGDDCGPMAGTEWIIQAEPGVCNVKEWEVRVELLVALGPQFTDGRWLAYYSVEVIG